MRPKPQATTERTTPYAGLVHSLSQPVIVTDRNGAALCWSRTAAELLEAPAEAPWAPLAELLEIYEESGGPALLKNLTLAICDLRPVFIPAAELHLKRAGVRLHSACSVSPLVGEDGTAAGAVIEIHDADPRRSGEKERHRVGQQRVLRRMAAGIAHGFVDYLTVVSGQIERLRGMLPFSSQATASLDVIEKATENRAAATRQLLAFSRHQPGEPRTLDLNGVISAMEDTIRRAAGDGIQVTFSPAADIGEVSADPAQLEQVVWTLVTNSMEAMEGSGRLTLATRRVEIDRAYSSRLQDCSPGLYVQLSVSDTGPGMDRITREHLFEPFFTTKSRRTGLSLWAAYGIVSQAGGCLDVSSDRSHGTVFKVFLPSVDGRAPAAKDRGLLDEYKGSETVLIVDDERPIQSLVRETLTSCGYQVLEASDGAAALRICEQAAAPIHLLLTDIIMPGIGGRELAVRAVNLHPQMRVLLMSGFTEYAVTQHGGMDSDTVLLEKPFTAEQLLRTVRDVLQA